MTTPPRQAQQNGFPGNLNATNAAAGINQFLGTPEVQPIYDGTKILATGGGSQLTFVDMTNELDIDQAFTLSGTTIGRVQLPLLPYGDGADVTVSLYPDNGSGFPDTSGNPIASVKIPAAYLNNVVAVEGLENATTPMMNELNNELAFSGNILSYPWLTPSSGADGSISTSTVCTTSDTMLFLGGLDGAGTAPVTYCASTTAQNQTLTQPVPQPSLPEALWYGGATVASETTVVYVGGSTASSPAVTNVWAASWDQGTHTMGSWSSQAALPNPIQHSAVASWGNFVYVVGGADASNNPTSSVYFATVSNNQIASWHAAPFPIALVDAFAVTCQGFLFVFGGRSNFSTSTGLQSTYWSKINASDGSLGPWQTGTPLPNGKYAGYPGWDCFATQNAVFQVSGEGNTSSGPIQTMAVTENGPSGFWYVTNWANVGDNPFLAVSLGAGQYSVFSPVPYNQTYFHSTLTPMPFVSTPLYATGLTSGNTYHLLFRGFTESSASDGVQLGILDDHPLPAEALQSPRYGNTWTPVITSIYSVPIRVWDASATSLAGANGLVRHAWVDPVNGQGQAWSGQFYNGLNLLTGIADVTMQPNNPLNSNPTFTSGTSPWTAVNGTLTQSSAQTHGGFAFSGLLTPTGGFTQAFAASESIAFQQFGFPGGQWFMVGGWFFSPTGWSNFSLSINWFDAGENYLSTSFNTASLPINTWTQVVNYFQPPTEAAFMQIVPTESGSPSGSNLLYMSDVSLTLTPETVGALASVAEVDYGSSVWPPIGVTQLN